MDITSVWPLSRVGKHTSKGGKKGWLPIHSGETSIDGSDGGEEPCLGGQTESESQSERGGIELAQQYAGRESKLSFWILLLSVLTLAAVALWPTSPRLRNIVLDCGNSPEEAAAKGCTFDILESAWVHPECSDMDLQNQYNPLGIWSFFEDKDMTRPISQERAAAGVDQLIYTQPGFHQAHFVYIFDKMTRAILARKPVNTRMLRESHVNHCAMQMLILKHQFNDSATTVGRNYIPCDWTYL